MVVLHYKHSQIGYLLIIVLGIALIVLVALASYTGFPVMSIIVITVLALCLLVFSTLTVTITDTALEFYFGRGFMGKRLPIDELSGYRTVKNPWYYGWGIHAIPGGWVYNVSGFDAVELTLRNGRKYRIGTDEPDRLVATLRDVVGDPAR